MKTSPTPDIEPTPDQSIGQMAPSPRLLTEVEAAAYLRASRSFPAPRRLLTEAEAAAYLRVSRSFLAKKRCSGGGPRFCKIGRRVLYDIADLDAFAEQAKRRSTSEAT